MADWAAALSSGLGAAANTGAQIIGDQMKQQQQLDAEQRAADIKLDLAQRMAAADEMMKNRAAERFSGVVKAKMSEDLPLEIAPGDPAPQNPADMVRHRTLAEATRAAKEETLQNDAPAFIAGTGMLAADNKYDATAHALEVKEKLAKEEGERKERIAQAHDDSREAVAQARLEALVRRLDGGGKNVAKSAMVQNLEWLKTNLKFSDQQLADFVTEKKRTSAEDIAAKLLSADKFGELTPESAMEKATKLVQARDKLQAGPAPADGKAAPATPPASRPPLSSFRK